jgi:hypothetical protein
MTRRNGSSTHQQHEPLSDTRADQRRASFTPETFEPGTLLCPSTDTLTNAAKDCKSERERGTNQYSCRQIDVLVFHVRREARRSGIPISIHNVCVDLDDHLRNQTCQNTKISHNVSLHNAMHLHCSFALMEHAMPHSRDSNSLIKREKKKIWRKVSGKRYFSFIETSPLLIRSPATIMTLLYCPTSTQTRAVEKSLFRFHFKNTGCPGFAHSAMAPGY